MLTYNMLYIGKLLVASDGDGLNEELVAASGIEWRLLLHRLQKDYGVLDEEVDVWMAW